MKPSTRPTTPERTLMTTNSTDWLFNWNDKDTGDETCAYCGNSEPGDGWFERAPDFRICSAECSENY